MSEFPDFDKLRKGEQRRITDLRLILGFLNDEPKPEPKPKPEQGQFEFDYTPDDAA